MAKYSSSYSILARSSKTSKIILNWIPMTAVDDILKMWDFPWPVVDVLLSGRSALDMDRLQVKSMDEATEFAVGYGFDPTKPADQRLMHGMIIEATNFINRKLLNARDLKKGVVLNDEVSRCTDPRELLMWASEEAYSDRGGWACAVLRVMHTITHIDGMTRYASMDIAREQIMKRFEEHIFRQKDGSLWIGDKEEKVRIENVEWKRSKPRESMILKLLHKKDNVAETIYDQLGIRIVATRLCDVMMIVKFLRTFHMVTYTNCVPTRSRSNLIDLDRFKVQIETLRGLLEHGQLTPKHFDTLIGRVNYRGEVMAEDHNPHSADSYKSVQLTCRQLIRARNPQLGWLDKIKKELDQKDIHKMKQKVLEELRYFVEHWHTVRDQREIKAFFPFEVQILDAVTYSKILSGDASHTRYKASQIRAARKRVLAQVFANVRKNAGI